MGNESIPFGGCGTCGTSGISSSQVNTVAPSNTQVHAHSSSAVGTVSTPVVIPVPAVQQSVVPRTRGDGCCDTPSPAIQPCPQIIQYVINDTPHQAPCATQPTSCLQLDDCSRSSSKVLSKNAINMPNIGGNVSMMISVSDEYKLFEGGFLYDSLVGHLQILSWGNGVVSLKNNGYPENLLSGMPVAKGTCFFLSAPNISSALGSSLLSGIGCLVDGFYIPAANACTDYIRLTSTSGLQAEQKVTFAGRTFKIGEVVANTGDYRVKFCNVYGEPAGVYIEATTDTNGNFTTCLTVTGQVNFCDAASGTTDNGKLLACDGASVKQMVGTLTGQAPVWNNATGQFELRNIPVGEFCTTLTRSFDVDTTSTSGLVHFASVVGFQGAPYNPLTVVIKGRFFSLSNLNVVAKTATATAIITPGGLVQYDAGDTVCIADCCAQCKPTMALSPSEVATAVPLNIGLGFGVSLREVHYLSPLPVWRLTLTNRDSCTKLYSVQVQIIDGINLSIPDVGGLHDYRVNINGLASGERFITNAEAQGYGPVNDNPPLFPTTDGGYNVTQLSSGHVYSDVLLAGGQSATVEVIFRSSYYSRAATPVPGIDFMKANCLGRWKSWVV